MALFDTLLTPEDENATATLHALLKGLQAKVTKATVHESLLQHPEFPSLLSLSDVLTHWQVDNTGLQLNTVEQLRELPFSFHCPPPQEQRLVRIGNEPTRRHDYLHR